MGLAVVRTLAGPKRLRSAEDAVDYEQELVDQFLLACVAAGLSDSTVSDDRAVIFELSRFLGRPLWTIEPADVDRYLGRQREIGRARTTIVGKVAAIAKFYDFLVLRYQGDIHTLTGFVVSQPVDEFNRPTTTIHGAGRVPPPIAEVQSLFEEWRADLPHQRKYLTAARDYFAASLWRRAGLRINETVMLDVRDWRPDLGEFGKLHVRFGKGSRGRGAKTRLTPAINDVDALVQWWLTDVRHQFGDEWQSPNAPMLPSERRDPHTGMCGRVGDDALRAGLAEAVRRWLPDWSGRFSPHGLRHFCASSLYAQGMDLKAIQELLGHEWLSTTTSYIHVHEDHIERAWSQANQRVAARLGTKG